MHCVTTLEVRSLRSRCQQRHASTGGARKWPVPGLCPSFWWFAGHRWGFLTCRHITRISASSSHGIFPVCASWRDLLGFIFNCLPNCQYLLILVDHMLSDERGWLYFVSIMPLIPGPSQSNFYSYINIPVNRTLMIRYSGAWKHFEIVLWGAVWFYPWAFCGRIYSDLFAYGSLLVSTLKKWNQAGFHVWYRHLQCQVFVRELKHLMKSLKENLRSIPLRLKPHMPLDKLKYIISLSQSIRILHTWNKAVEPPMEDR